MERIAYKQVSPAAYRALLALEGHVRASGLERSLVDLVNLRVSQQNGCAFCVDMHDKDLRHAGERPERLAMLAVWRESTAFSSRERAALSWAEALTSPGVGGPSDAAYEEARAALGDGPLVELTLAVAAIHAWNRLNVAFRTPAGGYRPEGT